MKFEFAKYTEVTELAFQVNEEYKAAGYTRLFICPDVNDAQFIRVLPGFGSDYNPDRDSIVVEHQMFPNRYKGQEMTKNRCVQLLKDDDFSNWDYHVFPDDMDLVISSINDGFGILNLKTAT